MIERDYTPTKVPQPYFKNTSPRKVDFESTAHRSALERLVPKEQDHYKLQARQLETQNRQLLAEIEKLKYEKNLT